MNTKKKGLKLVLLLMATITVIMSVFLHIYNGVITRLRDQNKKKQEFYDVLCAWLRIHESGETINDFLIRHKFKRIMVYGMKEIGELLCDEISKCESIKVVCAIDKTANHSYKKIEILKPDDPLPEADVLVVTAIHYYNEIEDNMRGKVTCPILSIEDIVFG